MWSLEYNKFYSEYSNKVLESQSHTNLDKIHLEQTDSLEKTTRKTEMHKYMECN